MFITMKNIMKTYGEDGGKVHVLNGITAEIEEKEICVILGASGSGKSTLLNVIGGLDSVDNGKITIDGLDISNMKVKELAMYRRKCIGFVFQFYNLIPNLTVKENIQTCEYLTDEPLDIDELIEVLGLSEHQNKFPSQLSGGQQQRCSIARALIKRPKLLLCDEPTGALDYKTSKTILSLLEEVNQKFGTTILMVTHNEAMKSMANRVIRIRDGIIVEIINNDTIVSPKNLEW